jgi:hypothetical protein
MVWQILGFMLLGLSAAGVIGWSLSGLGETMDKIHDREE